MRSLTVCWVSLIAGLLVATCGTSTVLMESTPRPNPVDGMQPIAPPKGKVSVPMSQQTWTPKTIGSARGDDLSRALRDKKTLALILPRKGAVASLEDRVFQMIKAAAPESKVVVRARANLDRLFEERGEIPYRVTNELKGTNASGDPYYVPREHPLNTDWLAKREPLKGAEGMVLVRPFTVNNIRLGELKKKSRGGCDKYIAEMEGGLLQAKSFFEQYEKKANERVAEAFRRHIGKALPFWRADLAQSAKTTAPGSLGEKCLKAYRALLDKYEPCLNGNCAAQPRVHASDGIVGTADLALLIPDKCPEKGMRDYAAELMDVTARAVAEVLPVMDSGWAGEIVRYKGAESLVETIEEACLPRHRRIHTENLEAVRGAVNDYLSSLRTEDLKATWEPAQGIERIKNRGPLTLFARVMASGNDPSPKLKILADQIKDLDYCNAGREQLYQASVIDVSTAEVLFMGLFFEEELLCEGLAPMHSRLEIRHFSYCGERYAAGAASPGVFFAQCTYGCTSAKNNDFLAAARPAFVLATKKWQNSSLKIKINL